jgi:hypothetical protein
MNMTAAQLTHLAELAASAADFFAGTDPDIARVFADAALNADALSGELRRAESATRRRTDLTAVQSEVTSGLAL